VNEISLGYNRRYIAIITLLLAPLSCIALDMYAPSLPAITHFFHVSATISKLTMTLYLIGFGIGQVIFGSLIDSYGRRKPLVCGTFVFFILSFIIAYFPNLYLLLIMRCFQGMCAASVSVTVKAVNADTFEGDELVRVSTYYSATWSASLILAPIIGSYLQHFFDWQANFYFFAIYGLIASLLALSLPETSSIYHKFSPIASLKKYSQLLTHKEFIAGSITIGIGFTCVVLFSMIGPFLIIRDLGHNVIFYGHIAFLAGLMTLLGSILTRLSSYYFKQSTIVSMSIYLLFISSIVFLILSKLLPMSLLLFILPIFIINMCDSFYFPSYFSKLMALFPNNRGSASAAIGMMISIIPFVVTLAVSLIPIYTLLPISSIYFSLCLIIFLLYTLVFKNCFKL
jgi:DHA1 family bicyclomycin/chloramphenicol resistance-like MFS transporter